MQCHIEDGASRNLPCSFFYSFGSSILDSRPPALFNKGHGREPGDNSLDLSRTVGWFTTMQPLNIEASEYMFEVVRRTKNAWRSVPGNGWPYFTSRHLNDSSTGPVAAEIVFNFQGIFPQLERRDALLKLVPIETPSFSRQGLNVERPWLFEISVAVHEKQIHFDFVFIATYRSRDVSANRCTITAHLFTWQLRACRKWKRSTH